MGTHIGPVTFLFLRINYKKYASSSQGFWSLYLCFFCRKCSHFQDKNCLVSFVLIAVLDAKELSAAGERIRHSLDLTEVLQDLN